jgi:hypothetical protein
MMWRDWQLSEIEKVEQVRMDIKISIVSVIGGSKK